MEYLIVFGIILVLVLIFGQSFVPLMVLVLGLMGLFAVLCDFFFGVMALLAIAARPKKAVFVDVEKDDRGIGFAFYEIEGEEYRNTFPTDAFLRKLLYNRKNMRVRLLRLGDLVLVFDRVTLWIIGIGLPFFGVAVFALYSLIQYSLFL
ncbi:MAG: P2X purinoceptor [Acetatifactor sp.]|nr:P2X purinoceptor [Acetatifactor sp.]